MNSLYCEYERILALRSKEHDNNFLLLTGQINSMDTVTTSRISELYRQIDLLDSKDIDYELKLESLISEINLLVSSSKELRILYLLNFFNNESKTEEKYSKMLNDLKSE